MSRKNGAGVVRFIMPRGASGGNRAPGLLNCISRSLDTLKLSRAHWKEVATHSLAIHGKGFSDLSDKLRRGRCPAFLRL